MQPWPSFHISPNKVGVQKSSEDNIEKISSLCSQENALSAVIFPVFPSPPGPVDLGDCLVHCLLVFIRPPSSSSVVFACSFRVIPLHKNHICLFFFSFLYAPSYAKSGKYEPSQTSVIVRFSKMFRMFDSWRELFEAPIFNANFSFSVFALS